MKIRRFGNLIKESVINSRSFSEIKVKIPCKKKLYEEYPDQSFIVVLNSSGKVIIYEKGYKNTFNNLREVVSLFGSKFFNHSIVGTEFGDNLKKYYEDKTGLEVRDIYKIKL